MRTSDRLVWDYTGIIAVDVWTNVTDKLEVLCRVELIDDTPLESILLYVLLSNCDTRFREALRTEGEGTESFYNIF